ncbi:MAG TPA: hypothetical protein VHD59_06825 [Pseudolabrys sp.]|nr:hypothetical protein [Pseudolabrys sp.]
MIESQKMLAGLPSTLRDALLKTYQEIAANFAEHRWEPSELNGGKFCEAAYSVVNGALSGKFPAKPSKPKDMVSACRALENVPPDANRVGDRSLRILIPRLLPALYEIRNNRGVGHIGGDVDPNLLDATAVYAMASWTLAELVRVFHGVSTEEAQASVDALMERKHPLIWDVADIKIKRVLDPSMPTSDQTLVLLHQNPSWVPEEDLAKWIGYSSVSMYRTRTLEPLHTKRLIEYDKAQRRARISPIGSQEVETRILKTRTR